MKALLVVGLVLVLGGCEGPTFTAYCDNAKSCLAESKETCELVGMKVDYDSLYLATVASERIYATWRCK